MRSRQEFLENLLYEFTFCDTMFPETEVLFMNLILPDYDQIPNVGLYLEQVTKYLNDYLEPMGCAPLTGSMVSNYVKKGLVRNPVKKQYDREHLARLLVIAVGKTVLSLEDIALLLESHPHGREGYEAFCGMLTGTLREVFAKQPGPLLQDTLTAVAHKLYLEAQLREADKC